MGWDGTEFGIGSWDAALVLRDYYVGQFHECLACEWNPRPVGIVFCKVMERYSYYSRMKRQYCTGASTRNIIRLITLTRRQFILDTGRCRLGIRLYTCPMICAHAMTTTAVTTCCRQVWAARGGKRASVPRASAQPIDRDQVRYLRTKR